MKEADGVVADLTITSKRLHEVDLTQPYIHSRLDMVVPLSPNTISGWWSFALPFSWDLWLTIVGAYLLAFIIIFFVEPFEQNEEGFERGQLQWPQRFGKTYW